MREDFKEFWSAHRLLLVTILTLVVALIGGYLILISAKSHVEFWPAIGSWVGGVATVYAVCIAIIEYKNRKRLDGAYELLDFAGLVGGDLYIAWNELCINLISSNSFRELHINNEDIVNHTKAYTTSLKEIGNLHLKFMNCLNKFHFLAYSLKFISPKKYILVKDEILNINNFLKDFNEYTKVIDFANKNSLNPDYLTDFRKLSDKISKKDYRGGTLNISKDHEWKMYLENARTTVFQPLLAKLKTLN
ncbi:hypothetical protein [Pseudoalteromonas sp. TAB23]|uniref:hypothetical protein n=1 Tax=Pseudoalteromonas sp. TAB23 TaxID=1938595 RepID=UPI0004093DC9|nr:hypothetical protein [Pseudoalteromonas sp. TAB23]